MDVPTSRSSHSTGPRDTARVFLRLLRMLRPHWAMIGLGIGLMLAAAPAELFAPLAWKWVTDVIALQNHAEATGWLTSLFTLGGRVEGRYALLLSAMAWMFGVYLAGSALGTLHGLILNTVAQRFILALRNRVYHKLQTQSLSYLHRQRTGDLMSRAMGDVDELQSFIVGGIDTILGEGVMWVLTVATVLWIDWRVGGVSVAPLVVVFFMLRYFNRRIAPIYRAVRERAADVTTRLQENLSGVVVIKIFGREREEADRFRAATVAHYDQQVKGIQARSLFFPTAQAVGFLSNVFMIGVGGYFMIKDGSFSPGDLVALRGYWWRLFGPIHTLARVNDMIQRAAAAGRRVFEVLDAPDELPEPPDAVDVPSVRGAMALRGVTFGYLAGGTGTSSGTGGSPVRESGMGGSPVRVLKGEHGRAAHATCEAHATRSVLHDVCITIEPGQTVALCGPSGSGKSTILNLLLRFYDPTAGTVTLDGRDLRSIRRRSLRSHFALVQQETFLFNDSIMDNVRYGHAEATMAQVVAAATAAGAHEFIAKLADGYDTKVGERGVRLSGGQKQRISIARAFLANPTVLLLDEPTSSVEPDGEAAIIAALARLMAGRTTVLTSHRPSLVGGADVVYVIDDGRVADRGAPAELVRTNPWFERFMTPDAAPATAALASTAERRS